MVVVDNRSYGHSLAGAYITNRTLIRHKHARVAQFPDGFSNASILKRRRHIHNHNSHTHQTQTHTSRTVSWCFHQWIHLKKETSHPQSHTHNLTIHRFVCPWCFSPVRQPRQQPTSHFSWPSEVSTPVTVKSWAMMEEKFTGRGSISKGVSRLN